MNGSPLYRFSPEHLAGLIALAVVPVVWLLLRRTGARRLAPIDQLLVGLLTGSAAVHVGLALGNDHGPLVSAPFLLDAVLLSWVARRVLRGSRTGRLGVAVLAGSIVAYWGAAVISGPPDQLGLAIKLAEILALVIVLRPAPAAHRRRLGALARGAAICLLVVGTAATSWLGAFRASAADPGAVAGHNVHGGSVPPPGTIFAAVPDREPTPAERAAADDLVRATRASLVRYADPAQAAADGYRLEGFGGIDFHANNPAYENDGRIFDPARPEGLVYAVAPGGQSVLLGAVFLMPGLGQPGPVIGGPLTTWHGHENVCISLTPLGLSGLLGPLGTCPVGSILVPRTAEMIHLWVVPGAPEPFGDLDEAWKRAYLRSVATRP